MNKNPHENDQQLGFDDHYRQTGEVHETHESYTKKRKRRRMKKALRRAAVLLAAVIVMLGLAWVVTGIIQKSGTSPSGNPISTPASTDDMQPVVSIPGGANGTVPITDNTAWNVAQPLQPMGSVQPVVEPDRRMLALPENGRVDMSYFDTTVFVGDSLTQGLQIYSQGIPNAKYCAYKGISPRQIYDGSLQTSTNGTKEVPMDALVAYQPDNVYVLLGTNAMVGMADEPLLAYYSEMLDTMRARLLPGVSIYVQSITPVLQGVDARFDFDRINYLNDQLAKLAFEKGMYFIDLHEALAGDDGWLRTDYGASRDGYHLNPTGYTAWVEYLVTHTAFNQRHAHQYIPGNHQYQQLPPPTPVTESTPESGVVPAAEAGVA